MPAPRAAAQRPLAEYKRKRNFSSTPEPSGDESPRRPRGKARYFCVQKHLASHLHYDFRLEHNGVLLSWAVPKGPSLNPKDKRLAMRVEDHPWDYRSFEGVIPEGYGAGIVMLWDKGTWKPEAGFDDIDRALSDGELKFSLDGVKLKGSWVLVRTRGSAYGRREDEAGESRSWLLIKHRDDWSGAIDVTKVAPLSVKSQGDFADILAKDDPDIWESHRPAEGGETGRMLRGVIAQAADLRAKRAARRGSGSSGKKQRPATRRKAAGKSAGKAKSSRAASRPGGRASKRGGKR